MSEYFIIVNHYNKEFLDPFSIGLPANLESVITGLTSQILTYIITPNLRLENRFKNSPNKYRGKWYNNQIQIIGDTTHQTRYRDIYNDYKDITQEALKDYLQANIIRDPQKVLQITTQIKQILGD